MDEKSNTQYIDQLESLRKSDVKIAATISKLLAARPKSKPMDPRREKDMKEICTFIRKYQQETGDAPKTDINFYKIGKVLGKGAFGKVSLGIHKLTGKFVAVKSISKQVMKDEASKTKVLKEVAIWEQVTHESVIRLYEMFETEKHLFYVEELCVGGDLLTYVRKRRRLKEPVARHVLKQILDGLYYIHSKGIVHRDIKLDNLLLNSEGKLKICDFGVSKVVKPGERMTEQCGTPAYIAPEILRDRGYEGHAVDIWSAGVVLFAMVYGTVPFKASSMSELHRLILKGNFTLKDDVSEEVRDLISKMLEIDPRKRFTIPQILCHRWFAHYDPDVTLFTPEEKAAIEKEFTYSERMKKNTLEGSSGCTLESDWFTEQNIENTECDLTKNITTKSVILAPFNSSITIAYVLLKTSFVYK